jgi:hypothetical protein
VDGNTSTLVGIFVLGLLVYFFYKWQTSKAEVAHWKKRVGHSERDAQLAGARVRRVEERERQAAVKRVDELASAMLEDIVDWPGMPDVQTIERMVASMGPDMRERVSIAAGVSYGQHIADVTTQEGEGIAKLREIQIRLAIYHQKVVMVAGLQPINLQVAMKGVEELAAIIDQYRHLEGPAWELAAHVIATFWDDYVRQLQQHVGESNALKKLDSLKLLVERAGSDFQPRLEEKAGAGQGAAEDEEDVIDADFFDDLPGAFHQRQAARGNGRVREDAGQRGRGS